MKLQGHRAVMCFKDNVALREANALNKTFDRSFQKTNKSFKCLSFSTLKGVNLRG